MMDIADGLTFIVKYLIVNLVISGIALFYLHSFYQIIEDKQNKLLDKFDDMEYNFKDTLKEIKQKQNFTIDEIEKKVNTLNAVILNDNKNLSQISNRLQELNEIKDLIRFMSGRDVAEYMTMIKVLEDKLEQFEVKSKREIDTKIAEKEKEIDRLRKEQMESKRKLSESDAVIRNKSRELSELQGKLNGKKSLEREISELESRIRLQKATGHSKHSTEPLLDPSNPMSPLNMGYHQHTFDDKSYGGSSSTKSCGDNSYGGSSSSSSYSSSSDNSYGGSSSSSSSSSSDSSSSSCSSSSSYD